MELGKRQLVHLLENTNSKTKELRYIRAFAHLQVISMQGLHDRRRADPLAVARQHRFWFQSRESPIPILRTGTLYELGKFAGPCGGYNIYEDRATARLAAWLRPLTLSLDTERAQSEGT